MKVNIVMLNSVGTRIQETIATNPILYVNLFGHCEAPTLTVPKLDL